MKTHEGEAGARLDALARRAKKDGQNDLADALTALAESEQSGRNLKAPDAVIKTLAAHGQTFTQNGRSADAVVLLECAMTLSVISGSNTPPRAFLHALHEEARRQESAAPKRPWWKKW